jgi:hypothetical protein
MENANLMIRRHLHSGCLIAACAILIPLAASCVPEDEPISLLKIGDAAYDVESFSQYLGFSRPTQTPPFDPEITRYYLDKFVEHRLLYRAAEESGITGSSQLDRFESELSAISKFLNNAVYKDVEIDPGKVDETYRKEFTEHRVRIRSIYFQDQRQATSQYNHLRRRPRDFESLMERYNPEDMKESGMGQGTFTPSQMPENVREAVFERESPGVVGPIDIGSGYLVVKVEEFLDPPPLEEVRYQIEEELAAKQRSTLRQQCLDMLKEKYEVEVHPELVLESAVFTKQTRSEEASS